MDQKEADRQAKKEYGFVFAAVMAAAILAFLSVDLIKTRYYKEEPLFCLPIIQYQSGCTDYYGLGYKIHGDFHPYDKTTEYTVGLWIMPDKWCV